MHHRSAFHASNATTNFNNCTAVGFEIATSTDPSIPGSHSSELMLIATVDPSLLRMGVIISSAKNLLVFLANYFVGGEEHASFVGCFVGSYLDAG